MALIYENWDPVARRYTEIETDQHAGLVITHTQDTKAIIESCKAIASNFDATVRRDTIHVARVPLVVWQRWQKLGITGDPKRLAEALNDRDNSVFRVDDRSKL
jgi:hypothetical protein